MNVLINSTNLVLFVFLYRLRLVRMFGKIGYLVILAIALQQASCSSLQVRTIIKRDITLTTEQLACLTSEIVKNLDSTDVGCTTAFTTLASLYTSTLDEEEAIANLPTSTFTDFCRAECGQVLIEAWQECGVYEEVEDVASLLVGLCAERNNDVNKTACYTFTTEIFQYYSDGLDCYNDLKANDSVCSDECKGGAQYGADTYRCCVNVGLQYKEEEDDEEPTELERLLKVYEQCDVTQPKVCTNNPLKLPSSSSATSHVATLMMIAVVCLVAIFAGLM